MCSRVVSPLCADATRLWCVMELFVYLRMGGQRESIVIKLLDDGDDLPRKLARFDTGKARCFIDNDRQKLLAVIEASFGTFHPFNSLVRGIFSQKLGKPPSSQQKRSVEKYRVVPHTGE